MARRAIFFTRPGNLRHDADEASKRLTHTCLIVQGGGALWKNGFAGARTRQFGLLLVALRYSLWLLD